MNNKTKADLATEGAASVFMGIGCAPFVMIPVWVGLAILLSLIFGAKVGVIAATVIVVILIVGLIVGGVFKLGQAAASKTVSIACPYCMTENKVLKKVVTFECKECKQPVLVKDGMGNKLG